VGCVFLRKNEIVYLRLLTILGLVSLPFLFRKKPTKDWIIVFLIKAVYSIFWDSMIVKFRKVNYPVRLFPKIFKINVAFDLLLFPIACVIYNQITYHKTNFREIILKAFYVSVPIIVIEIWLEKGKRLIKYKDGWNWFISFVTLNSSSWIVRLLMALIRRFDKSEKSTSYRINRSVLGCISFKCH
jgi:hypothetical protein